MIYKKSVLRTISVLLALMLILSQFGQAFAIADKTTLVTIASNGTPTTGNPDSTSIAPDERFVAFESFAKNPAAGGGNGIAAVYPYDPQNSLTPITRAQMAIFLLKGIHTSAYIPPAATGVFTDVPVGHWAAAWIEQLFTEGISGGCGGGMYCPDVTITHAQIAIFLLKSIHGSSYAPPAVGASTGFTDVTVGHWAAAWIKQLAAESISSGCGAGLYCPDSLVTRAQMEEFIIKAFGENITLTDIMDPSFEVYTPNPYWAEFSTNFGTPLCTVEVCGTGGGTAGPRIGSAWGWFGGVLVGDETASLSQTITIPNGIPNLKLQFYFWIGAAAPGSNSADVFTAKIDGVTVFSANATQQALYPTYTPVLVDLSAFANNAPHTITFSSVTTGQLVNFNLDDVSLTDVTFFDVPSDYWALQFIERLYNAGITGGCGTSPLIYCPDATVTRAQMAVFLLKGIYGSSYAPPAVGVSTGFTDVATGYWAAAWIKQLAAEGITGGCGSGNYCPDAIVTRAQMAIFLLKAKHGSSYSPPTATGVFTDVPVGYWADKWIEQLAVEGVTSGCGAGIYCPDSSVTRAQMAVFLVKAFNLP